MGIFFFFNLMGGTKEVYQRFFKDSKKLLVFEFWWVVLIFDYAPTSSFRGPATQHLNPRPKAEFRLDLLMVFIVKCNVLP